MIISSLVRSLAHAVLDAAIADGPARRAAQAGFDAAMAPAALALGDVPVAAQAGASAVTRLAGATADPDAEVASALDFIEGEAGRLASGDFAAALIESGSEKAAGLVAGGAAESATQGELTVMDGLTLSRGLAHGLVRAEAVAPRLAAAGTRAGAGLAGGVGATLAADPKDQAAAFRYGAQLGFRLEALRTDPEVGSRLLRGAELAAEWSVAAGVRANKEDLDWTEALGFGRRIAVGASAVVRGAGAARRSRGDGVDDLAGPVDDRWAASRAREVDPARARLADAARLAGGAASLVTDVGRFVAQQEATQQAQRAAATGDEHGARAAAAARAQITDVARLGDAAAGLMRAAWALEATSVPADRAEQ